MKDKDFKVSKKKRWIRVEISIKTEPTTPCEENQTKKVREDCKKSMNYRWGFENSVE